MRTAVCSLTIRLELGKGHARLTAAGELDIAAAPRLAAAATLIPPGSMTVLDLAGVTFADVTGYRALSAACRVLESQGTLMVTGTPACVTWLAALMAWEKGGEDSCRAGLKVARG